MADRLFLHIGAPKTGTTFLQNVLAGNQDVLREQGVHYVTGKYPGDRIWAQEIARGIDVSGHPNRDAPGAWQRIREDVRRHSGDAVLSHEFFSACSAEQARWVVDQMAPAEVHVIFTARDYVRQMTAVWQERLKCGRPVRLEDFSLDTDNGTPTWSWHTIDMPAVLGRWQTAVPVDHIHVITVPPSTGGPSPLWPRFASVIGVDPESCSVDGAHDNSSLRLVESELLRRVGERLPDELTSLLPAKQWVSNVLARKVLSGGSGERLTLAPDVAERLVARSRADAEKLKASGYHVVGSADELDPGDPPPPGRAPHDVTDGELLEVAVEAIGGLLLEMRRLSDDQTAKLEAARRKVAKLEAAQRRSPIPGTRARTVLQALRGSDAPSVRMVRKVRSLTRRERSEH